MKPSYTILLCMRLLALQQPVEKDLRRVMTALSINSILERISALARRVEEMYNEVDNLDTEMFVYCIGRMKPDSALVEPGSHLLIVSRHAERLADQATNLAGSVIFLIEAQIVKHKNWNDPQDAHGFDEDDQLFAE